MTLRRILVPIDYSPGSLAALERAVELAVRLRAGIDVLHVLDVPGGDPENELRAFVSTITPKVRIAIGTRIEIGEAVSCIVRTAEEGGYDMIVVGTHGRRGVSRVILGSVAEELVRTSAIPVLTVRLGKAPPKLVPRSRRVRDLRSG